MIRVGTFEAKTHLSRLLDRVEAGEEVVITRHGKAVARIVAEGRARSRRGTPSSNVSRNPGEVQRWTDFRGRNFVTKAANERACYRYYHCCQLVFRR
jgi:antitoxin (DNA-binding transcriptional repressor) of toxin-antitoxin stability system